jgi:hypothetical protein
VGSRSLAALSFILDKLSRLTPRETHRQSARDAPVLGKREDKKNEYDELEYSIDTERGRKEEEQLLRKWGGLDERSTWSP